MLAAADALANAAREFRQRVCGDQTMARNNARLLQRDMQPHRSVSDGSHDWEYNGSSARDMASFGFLLSRLV
jgi:hypothetical protein